MGAAVSNSFVTLTAEEVAQLAEARARPTAVAKAIRDNELDGATVLAMDEDDVTDLATGLDRKKLLGGFRELKAALGREVAEVGTEVGTEVTEPDQTAQPVAVVARQEEEEEYEGDVTVVEEAEAAEEPEEEEEKQQETTRPAMRVEAISDVSLLDCSSREVLKASKYDGAWARLTLEERVGVTKLVKSVASRMRQIEDALASFLFDPKNQMKDERHGVRALLFQREAADAREEVLTLLRDLQKNEAKALETFVAAIVDAAFQRVPGYDLVTTTRKKTLGPSGSQSSDCDVSSSDAGTTCRRRPKREQPMESCFEGFDVSHVVVRELWTERVKTTMERAAKIVSSPDFHSLAVERCFVDPSDAIFLAMKIDNRDGRTTSLTWLYAEHLLLSASFHADVETAMETLTSKKLCRVAHARAKAGARAKEKTGPNGDYGRRTPKPATRFLKDILRCSLVFESHHAFEEGLRLILAGFAACGPPKDRRHLSPMHDVLLNVFYKDFIAEIQFHFASVLQVKPLAHLPYSITRTETANLLTLHLFDFPHVHLEHATRNDVKCRLAL
mmetsp:Transcript_26475/g.85596  ORF Transcript_26475/g.85596 Transcript_26475/m.85596 type:complete len:559 (+) Transcript_26475:775-2451(+)